MPRLLCVTAHPDDEAGGFGGSLLKYAEAGIQTHVICLTSGTAATHRGTARTDAELAEVRKNEFASSCELLKVHKAEALDYPDGGLATTPLLTVVDDLTARIRMIKPHVVMTFGSEGAVTAHPDHSMVSVFTTLAFQWAARTNRFPGQFDHGLEPWRAQKLYHMTTSFTMPERQPVAVSPWTAEITLTPEHVDAKVAAFKRHLSQAPLFDFFDRTIHARGNLERFLLVASVEPRKAEYETDLFAGVKE
jgi:LmbE family N-acetylglucosaminyl deacetylase